MKRRSKWVKTLVSVLLSVVLMVQMTGVVWGDSLSLGLPIISQTPEELCCWACCGTSVCQYYGVGITLDAFIYSVKGTYLHTVAGSLNDIQAGMGIKGITSEVYVNSYDSTIRVLTYQQTKTEISMGRPVVYFSKFYTQSSNHSAHAILVTGYEDSNSKLQITDSFKSAPVYHTYSSLISSPTEEYPYQLQSCLYHVEG